MPYGTRAPREIQHHVTGRVSLCARHGAARADRDAVRAGPVGPGACPSARRIVGAGMGTPHAVSPSPARHRAPERSPAVPARAIPRQQSGRAVPVGGAALFEQLAREWEARGATVPGRPDPLWERLITYAHLQRETDATLRSLRLAGDEPAPVPAQAPAPAGPRWTRA